MPTFPHDWTFFSLALALVELCRADPKPYFNTLSSHFTKLIQSTQAMAHKKCSPPVRARFFNECDK